MSSISVSEFILKEVPDWNNDVIATARFKAFSGQRSDWEPKFQFWRNLIIKIARHFSLPVIHPSQFVMYNEGDILRSVDLVDATSGRLTQLFRKVRNLMARSAATPEILLKDNVILMEVLKDKAGEVIKLLSECHWTSSCIITMKKFQAMCGGRDEASAVLSYLSGYGKALYLSISKNEFTEGVKVSLSPAAVSSISSLDCDVLHLIWTVEKLQQQLDVIDRHYEMSRKSALASLHSENKRVALRHAKQLKLTKESREKCASLLNRVEEVLSVIENAESTKNVSEAIQIGAQAIKKNKISVEELQFCLEELEENIDLRKQAEKLIVQSYTGIDDEDFEEEFKQLELEVKSERSKPIVPEPGVNDPARETAASESAESLSAAFSTLELKDGTATASAAIQDSVVPVGSNEFKRPVPERA